MRKTININFEFEIDDYDNSFHNLTSTFQKLEKDLLQEYEIVNPKILSSHIIQKIKK